MRTGREIVFVAVGFALLMATQIAATGAQSLFTRALWYDEYLTFVVASDPDLAHSMQSLAAGVEHHPPTFYLAQRAVGLVRGRVDEVGMRAFSLACTWVAIVATFALMRRVLPLWPSLVAATFVWAHRYVVLLAFEARSYAPWLAVAACFAWLLATLRETRRPTLHAITLGASAAILCTIHYFGIFTFALISAGDWLAHRSAAPLPRRGWLALLAGPLALVASIPFLLGQRVSLSVPTWIPPVSKDALLLSLGVLAPEPLLLAICCVPPLIGAGLLHVRGERPPSIAFRELAGLASLLLLPVVLLGFSVLVQPAYLARYEVCWILGAAAVAGVLATRVPRWTAIAMVAALAAFAARPLAAYTEEKLVWDRSTRRMANDLRALTDDAPVIFQWPKELYPLCSLGPECGTRYFALDFETAELPGATAEQQLLRDIGRVMQAQYGTPRTLSLAEVRHLETFYLVAPTDITPWFPGFAAKRIKHSLFRMTRN